MFTQVILDGNPVPYFINENGIMKNSKGVILKPYFIKDTYGNNSYYAIKLKRLPKGHKHQLIHRLVAMTFIGNIPEGWVVNHKDGNKCNNNITNLEIVPFEYNVQHGIAIGLTPSGENHRLSKHTNKEAHAVCQLLQEGKLSVPDIAKLLNVSRKFVNDIKFRSKWKQISKHYTFSNNIPKANQMFTDTQKDIMLNMMKDGYTNKQIRIKLGLPNEHKYVSAISYFRTRRFNDYPEKEYTQVGGKSGPLIIKIG